MQIALNAQLLGTGADYRSAGVSNYSRQLLLALGELAQARPDLHLTAFVPTADLTIPGVTLRPTRLPMRRPPVRIAWEQLLLPRALRREQADLVHGLVNVLPLATRVPGVVTIHDLSFIRTPEKFPPLKRWYLTQLCRASVTRASHVIAVSQQTAHDVQELFQVPVARTTVIHNGVAPQFTPGTADQIAHFRQARQLPARFILYLGTLEPRKNLPLLIRAYAQWRQQAAPAEQAVKLILAGGKGWYYDEIFQLVTHLGLQVDVLFPGFIPDAELADWYRAAELFVYPSLFEGFGLPVLEAMACGAPVICSAIPCLLEVVGQATLTFPATDEVALRNCLHQVMTMPTLRQQLRTAGLGQAAHFSWRKTAQATLAVYQWLFV